MQLWRCMHKVYSGFESSNTDFRYSHFYYLFTRNPYLIVQAISTSRQSGKKIQRGIPARQQPITIVRNLFGLSHKFVLIFFFFQTKSQGPTRISSLLFTSYLAVKHLRLFSHESRFAIAKNCNCDILNYAVYTREKTRSRICGLAFQSGEKKCGSFFDMLIDISFEIKFLLENAPFISGSG